MLGRSSLAAVLSVIFAILVVTAPASGAHTAAVSGHTSDTDFNNATTLENVSVSGTGSSASVELANNSAPLEAATILRSSGNVSYTDIDGQTTGLGISAKRVGGTGDFDGDGDLDIVLQTSGNWLHYVDNNGNVVNLSVGGRAPGMLGDIDGDGDLDVGYRSTTGQDDLNFTDASGNVKTTDTTVQAHWVGGVADIDGDGDLDIAHRDGGTTNTLAYIDQGGNKFDFDVEAAVVGGVGDFDDDGDLDIAYHNRTTIRYMDSNGNSVNMSSAPARDVGGMVDFDGDGDLDIVYLSDNNNLRYIDAAGNDVNTGSPGLDSVGDLDDFDNDAGKHESGRYISANHSAENVVEGWTNLSLTNATATVTWQGANGGAWNDVASTTYSTSGNKTLALSGGYTDWRVNVTFENESTSGDPIAELHDEGVLAQTHGPAVDNSSADPNTTDTTVDEDPVTLQINISDVDFPTPQGDSVNTSFYVDGQYRGSDIRTSNGTASVDLNNVSGGTHDWHVELEDSYGHTQTSGTFQFKAPSDFCLFEVNNPSTKVTDATVEMRFFASDGTTVVEKSTSSGCVDMGGLPAAQEFVVVMRADGYADRRVLIESLIEQQEGYLLNSTEHTTIFNRFELEDRTGQYPPAETTFFVDRALTKDFDGDGSNETQFTRIAGDGFGSQNRFPVVLQDGTQYRLRIKADGSVRILGRYLAAEEGTVTLTVGSVTFERVNGTTYTFEMETDDEANELIVRYYDPANSTTDFEVVVHERGNTSNELINETVAGPVGVVKIKQPLTENETDVAWVANWSADYNGTQIGDQTMAGGNAVILPMDPRWLGSIALLFITIVGTLGGNHQATTFTIIMVATAGFLMMFQFVDIPIPLYATAGLIAIGGRIRDTEGR